jgi:hypothetical protein
MNLSASHYSGFNADNEAATLGGLGHSEGLREARRETRDSLIKPEDWRLSRANRPRLELFGFSMSGLF